ncbi:hypothetical protein TIFTF001_034905 [Ficus carica]|uniref:Uncharacterized protein n=1 Tax=Ficus carica TaxID=3494 RepID=A0AA88E4K8_FICCA|nr:hypothetical protein TIFTF001_034905 [Ficus carica]
MAFKEGLKVRYSRKYLPVTTRRGKSGRDTSSGRPFIVVDARGASNARLLLGAFSHELVILRNGLPPQIRQYVSTPTPKMTMGHMVEYIMDAKVVAHAMQADAYVVELQVPVDDAGIGERIFEAGPVFLEDPIPAVPLQKVPTPEVEIEANDYDADDDMDAPEDQPEDPPIIDISSDDEDEDMEPEPESGDWVEDADDLNDDPEEILYDDGDWDTDYDASSVITMEYID